MTRRFLAAAGAALAVLLASAGPAVADPTNSPKSFTINAQCESGPITFTLLANRSPVGWTASTSVGVPALITFTDLESNVFVERLVPGFDANAVSTETCIVASPEGTLTVEVLLTPARS